MVPRTSEMARLSLPCLILAEGTMTVNSPGQPGLITQKMKDFLVQGYLYIVMEWISI
jgi:hypothetical protein